MGGSVLHINGHIGGNGGEDEPNILIISPIPTGTHHFVRSGEIVAEFRIGRAPPDRIDNFIGTGPVIIIHLVVDAEGKRSARLRIIDRDIIPVTYSKSVITQRGGGPVEGSGQALEFASGGIPEGSLRIAHVPVDVVIPDSEGHLGGDGLESKPNIFIIVRIHSGPAAGHGAVSRGQQIAVFGIGRTAAAMGNDLRSVKEVIGSLVGQAKGERSRAEIIIHRNIIPVAHCQAVDAHDCGTLIHQIAHAGHFVEGGIPEGHLSPPHASVYRPGPECGGHIGSGGPEPEPHIVQVVGCTPATTWKHVSG